MGAIVWTAVAAAAAGILAVAVSVAGGPLEVVIALGFAATTAALLNLKN